MRPMNKTTTAVSLLCALTAGTTTMMQTTHAFAPTEYLHKTVPPLPPLESLESLETATKTATFTTTTMVVPPPVQNSDKAHHPRRRRKAKMQRPHNDTTMKKRPKTHTKASTRASATTSASTKKKAVSSSSKQKPQERLTFEQETEYANRIRVFRAAVKLRDELVTTQHGVAIHPTEEQWLAACNSNSGHGRGNGVSTADDWYRICQEGREARARLAAAHAGLVVQHAKRYHSSLKYATEAQGGLGTILTISDLVQEGNLGLMEAAERFDPSKGFRFGTYATYWIRQRMLRSIAESSRTIRLPAHVHDTLQKVRRAKQDLKAQTGREPNLSELAQHMDVSEEKLRLYTASSRNVVSLSRPLARGSTAKNSPDQVLTLADVLPCDRPTPEEDATLQNLRSDVRSVLATALDPLERATLMHRYGLDDEDAASTRKGTSAGGKTVTETAALLQISRDRVRLLEARAMNKLRHPNSHYKLKDYYFQQQHTDKDQPDASLYHEPRRRRRQQQDPPPAVPAPLPAVETADSVDAANAATATASSANPDRIWFF